MATSRSSRARRSDRTTPRAPRPSELRKKLEAGKVTPVPSTDARILLGAVERLVPLALQKGLEPVVLKQLQLEQRLDSLTAPSGAGEVSARNGLSESAGSGVAVGITGRATDRPTADRSAIGNAASRLSAIAGVINVVRSRVAAKHQQLVGSPPANGKDQASPARAEMADMHNLFCSIEEVGHQSEQLEKELADLFAQL